MNQNNDVQLWITEAVSVEINPRFTFNLANEWRLGDNMSKLHYVYLQGILGMRWTDFLNMGSGYRQIWRLERHNWRYTYQPFVEFIFHREQYIQFRNRISYLINERAENFWQYRGRLRISSVDWTYNPFFSNEVFVHSHVGFVENRTMLGVEVPVYERAASNLYYMLKFLKQDRVWTHQHVFGIWLNFLY